MGLTNGRIVFDRLVHPVPRPVLFHRIGRQRTAVDPLERRDIDARIAHSMLAECAMAGQRMAPAKEDRAGLCIGARDWDRY